MGTKGGTISRSNLVDPCDVQRINTQLVAQQLAGGGVDQSLRDLKNRTPIGARGGHEPFTFDLGDARFNNGGSIRYEGTVYGMLYSIQSSVQGGVLDFDFQGGGTELACIPGVKFRGPINGFNISRNALSVTAGLVTLRMTNQPDVDITELARGFPSGLLGNPTGVGIGPSGAAAQAAGAVAGGVNRPVLATDGVSLSGVSGVRAIISAGAVNTISTVTALQWWQFDTAGNQWGVSDMQDAWGFAAATYKEWFPLDKQVWVPQGRVYAEVVGYTDSGGGNAIVRLNTWGS